MEMLLNEDDFEIGMGCARRRVGRSHPKRQGEVGGPGKDQGPYGNST